MTHTLLCTGTRHGRTDVWPTLYRYVETYGYPDRVIVGDATGVDAQVATFFREFGYGDRVHVEPAVGKWPAAGPRRNARMVGMCRRGDHCLAFPHADEDKRRGTTNCYTLAQAAGLLCWWI